MKLIHFTEQHSLILCNWYKCSVCDVAYPQSNPPDFCPRCGVKFEGIRRNKTPKEKPIQIETLGDVLRR